MPTAGAVTRLILCLTLAGAGPAVAATVAHPGAKVPVAKAPVAKAPVIKAPVTVTPRPLMPSGDGQTAYDPTLNVTWLANADLAATQTFDVAGIHPDGSMSYDAALAWVKAMNAADYLGHQDWTLPATPHNDASCSSTGAQKNSFAYGCLHSALGSLYSIGLGLKEPATAVPLPSSTTGPFTNFQPYMYWSSSVAAFSFNTGWQGENVDQHTLFVLPMIPGALPGTTPAKGTPLQPSADGKTVYDPVAKVTWLADANLAKSQTFGVAGIAADGAMSHDTATAFIKAMNAYQGKGWLGQKTWQLPVMLDPDAECSQQHSFGYMCTGTATAPNPLGWLYYDQLKLTEGQPVVATPNTTVGALHDIQPYLYWSCEGGAGSVTCDATQPAPDFQWSFSFANGFQGTDPLQRPLYVMVYYPGSPNPAKPVPPLPSPPPPAAGKPPTAQGGPLRAQ